MNPYGMFGRGGQKQVIHDLLQGINQAQLARMQQGLTPGGFGGDFGGMSHQRLQQIAKMMQAGQGNGLDPQQFFLQHHQGDGLFAGLRGQMVQGDPFRNGPPELDGGGSGFLPQPGNPGLPNRTQPGQLIPGRGVGRPPFAGGIGRLPMPGGGLQVGRPRLPGVGSIPMQPLNNGMHAALLMRALGR